MTMWPNQSPEPTAVGAVSSAIAVHVTGRRWLSFLRWASEVRATRIARHIFSGRTAVASGGGSPDAVGLFRRLP